MPGFNATSGCLRPCPVVLWNTYENENSAAPLGFLFLVWHSSHGNFSSFFFFWRILLKQFVFWDFAMQPPRLHLACSSPLGSRSLTGLCRSEQPVDSLYMSLYRSVLYIQCYRALTIWWTFSWAFSSFRLLCCTVAVHNRAVLFQLWPHEANNPQAEGSSLAFVNAARRVVRTTFVFEPPELLAYLSDLLRHLVLYWTSHSPYLMWSLDVLRVNSLCSPRSMRMVLVLPQNYLAYTWIYSCKLNKSQCMALLLLSRLLF